MYWEDVGFIISKRKFRENAIILEVFTNSFGKVSGIVYGGNSRKVKNYLQIMNQIFVVYKSKSENKIGYFNTELVKAVSPKYFDNKKKLLCLNSLSSILKLLLPENQSYKSTYQSLTNFLNNFEEKKWPTYYLNWELDLINSLGFGFEANIKDIQPNTTKKNINIKIDNIEYKIPTFLFVRKFDNLNNEDIYTGLNFSRTLLENKFFNPNNIKMPYSRKLLEKRFL